MSAATGTLGESIEVEHLLAAMTRASVELYRTSDALSEAEQGAADLRRRLANLQRDAQLDAEQIRRLSDAHDALYAEVAKERAHSAKLKRKLAKARGGAR